MSKNPDLRIGGCTALIHSGRETKPALAEAFFNRAGAYRARKEYDRALQDYDQAVQLNPNFSLAWYARGSTYASIRNYDRAIRDYDEALRLNPKDAVAFNDRGVAYSLKGDFDGAIRDYDKALRLNPNFTPALQGRGNAYAGKTDYLRAIQDFDQALRLSPNNAWTYRARGIVLFLLGSFVPAETELVKALRLEPANADTILWLYAARARAGKDPVPSLAAESERVNLDVWPGPIVRFYLGRTSSDQLLADAKDSHAYCDTYFFMAEQALLEGRRAEALELFRKAIAAGQSTFRTYTAAKEELERLGGPPSSSAPR